MLETAFTIHIEWLFRLDFESNHFVNALFDPHQLNKLHTKWLQESLHSRRDMVYQFLSVEIPVRVTQAPGSSSDSTCGRISSRPLCGGGGLAPGEWRSPSHIRILFLGLPEPRLGVLHWHYPQQFLCCRMQNFTFGNLTHSIIIMPLPALFNIKRVWGGPLNDLHFWVWKEKLSKTPTFPAGSAQGGCNSPRSGQTLQTVSKQQEGAKLKPQTDTTAATSHRPKCHSYPQRDRFNAQN